MQNLTFSDQIIRWYRANKRDLPWRQTSDPYRIWLSEVILQQTRVDQGMGYYFRILEAFPSVEHLANAHEDEVLKLWQGLGYYSRARNLHATARIVAQEYGGVFPNNYKGLLALKGVGPYTAAAIASFCFNEPVAVVDGNVERVLSRYFGIEDAVDATPTKKALQSLAQDQLSTRQPAEHNQAIMEFGALQCTPKLPQCDQCPLRASCYALRENKVSELPFKAKRTKVLDWAIDYFVLTDGHQVLFRKRMDQGIWRNLHDFPAVEGPEPLSPAALGKHIASYGRGLHSSERITHLLSHRKLSICFHRVAVKAFPATVGGVIVPLDDKEDLAVPKPIHDYLTNWE